jgi:hypothetical protein
MPAGLETELVRRVAELPSWDEVAAEGGLHLSAARLGTMEHLAPWYLALRRDARVEAVASCYLAADDATLPWALSKPSFLFRPYGIQSVDSAPNEPAAPLDPIFPFVLCGPAHGYSARLLVAPALAGDARRDAIAGLLEAVRSLAAAQGAKSFGFGFLPLDDARELAAHDPSLVPVYLGAECYLPVSTFDAYLASLKSHARQNAKREISHFQEEGLRMEMRPLVEVAETFARLGVANQEKHGVELSVDTMRAATGRWLKAAAGRDRVVCVLREDRVVGLCFFVRQGATLTGVGLGFEPDLPKRAAAYFNCMIYEGVRLAEREGATEIRYGLGSLAAKASHGCRCRPLCHVLDGRALTPDLRARLREGSRARIEEDLGILRQVVSADRSAEMLSLPALQAFVGVQDVAGAGA